MYGLINYEKWNGKSFSGVHRGVELDSVYNMIWNPGDRGNDGIKLQNKEIKIMQPYKVWMFSYIPVYMGMEKVG